MGDGHSENSKAKSLADTAKQRNSLSTALSALTEVCVQLSGCLSNEDTGRKQASLGAKNYILGRSLGTLFYSRAAFYLLNSYLPRVACVEIQRPGQGPILWVKRCPRKSKQRHHTIGVANSKVLIPIPEGWAKPGAWGPWLFSTSWVPCLDLGLGFSLLSLEPIILGSSSNLSSVLSGDFCLASSLCHSEGGCLYNQ